MLTLDRQADGALLYRNFKAWDRPMVRCHSSPLCCTTAPINRAIYVVIGHDPATARRGRCRLVTREENFMIGYLSCSLDKLQM